MHHRAAALPWLLCGPACGPTSRSVQAVLAAPMGGARLMDLLGSDHEVLRNEALLLLVGLTRASAEVQKIAAFEGAFERVLSIARCVACWPRRLRDAFR